jgi:Na+/H+ antiporter NhaD/arsenite permease-like protein
MPGDRTAAKARTHPSRDRPNDAGVTTAVVIAVFVGVYALIATERVHRVAAALGGAAIVLAVGAVGADDIFFSQETGIDWNVIFLLFGMMVMVGVLKQTGLFEYLAIWSAKRARGRPYRVMVMLCLITALASTVLPNVTIVLLAAPVTLLVCDRLGLRPAPFLIAEALASNIGGTATLIGDPPNLIIGSRADLSFNDFLVNLAPIVAVILVVFLALCRWLFRKEYVFDAARAEEVMELTEREAISDPRLLVRSLVILTLVIAGFVLSRPLDTDPSIVALLGAGLLVLTSRLDTSDYLEEVEWETLVFFMGLFILVGALTKVGVIENLADFAADATDGRLFYASMLLLWISGGLSAIVDNIPYVATMAPVVSELVAHAPTGSDPTVLWWALALGADLGGNATAVGASANVVVVGIAKRNGYPIGFWEFAKYGAVVAVVSLLLCVPYIWLRYFVLA